MSVYPLESGAVTARILYLWVEPHVAILHSEHSLIIMMKNHKYFKVRSVGRNGHPVLDWTQKHECRLKCDVLCFSVRYACLSGEK